MNSILWNLYVLSDIKHMHYIRLLKIEIHAIYHLSFDQDMVAIYTIKILKYCLKIMTIINNYRCVDSSLI